MKSPSIIFGAAVRVIGFEPRLLVVDVFEDRDDVVVASWKNGFEREFNVNVLERIWEESK